MALKKTIARLNDYQDRLKNNEVDRITVKHVEKIIAKLEAKDAELRQRLEEAKKPAKKERLEAKQKVIRDQIARARWLRKQVSKAS